MRILRVLHAGAAHYARSTSDPAQLELLSDAPWLGGTPTSTQIAAAKAQLLAPVTPSKIVCVGRNYAGHVKELGHDLPSEPLLFLKPPSALLAPEAAIISPPSSQRVEHEAEIGIVIGQRLTRATPERARAAIFGITCVNDVTARDLQRKDVQFTRAKGFDTFCPVGPWVQTEFAIETLSVTGRVNGDVRQHDRASSMIFAIPDVLSFISHVMTLEPGDLIATGTPEGVGPLLPGDTVEIEISGVGVLRNKVAALK
jgi:2-keto-4-pentenoate hydratase/2-oxohepta-3-ene-1,7-dioic acid hydratase in catechol pathway